MDIIENKNISSPPKKTTSNVKSNMKKNNKTNDKSTIKNAAQIASTTNKISKKRKADIKNGSLNLTPTQKSKKQKLNIKGQLPEESVNHNKVTNVDTLVNNINNIDNTANSGDNNNIDDTGNSSDKNKKVKQKQRKSEKSKVYTPSGDLEGKKKIKIRPKLEVVSVVKQQDVYNDNVFFNSNSPNNFDIKTNNLPKSSESDNLLEKSISMVDQHRQYEKLQNLDHYRSQNSISSPYKTITASEYNLERDSQVCEPQNCIVFG